jgi:hypothetical protein
VFFFMHIAYGLGMLFGILAGVARSVKRPKAQSS